MIFINDFSRKFEIEINTLCENSPYGARIISYFNAYHGKNYDFLDFWIQRNESDTAKCAFCKYYSTLIICGDVCDKAEVEDFVKMISPFSILCDNSLDLNIEMNFRKGETMKCDSVKSNSYSDYTVKKITSDMRNLKKVYALLISENDESGDLPDFEGYFLDISHRIRHATAQIYGILNDNDELLSTATLLAMTDTDIVIGCVATRNDSRKKGLATSIIGFILNNQIAKGKTIWLHREKEIQIYEKLGFEVTGEWREYTQSTGE